MTHPTGQDRRLKIYHGSSRVGSRGVRHPAGSGRVGAERVRRLSNLKGHLDPIRPARNNPFAGFSWVGTFDGFNTISSIICFPVQLLRVPNRGWQLATHRSHKNTPTRDSSESYDLTTPLQLQPCHVRTQSTR